MEQIDIAEDLNFPKGLPESAKIPEQTLIKRFEDTVLHSTGDVFMTSLDDARRIYEVLRYQCETDGKFIVEAEKFREEAEGLIEGIFEALPEDADTEVDAPYTDKILKDLALLLERITNLSKTYQEMKSVEVTMKQENENLLTSKPLVRAIGEAASGNMITVQFNKDSSDSKEKN